jgi:hypothetical protein
VTEPRAVFQHNLLWHNCQASSVDNAKQADGLTIAQLMTSTELSVWSNNSNTSSVLFDFHCFLMFAVHCVIRTLLKKVYKLDVILIEYKEKFTFNSSSFFFFFFFFFLLLLLLLLGWVETERLVAHCISFGQRKSEWSKGRVIIVRGRQKYLEKTCPSATPSATNPT